MIALSASLQTDLRFRSAPLELRGLYRMLLDFQDAAGDVVARGVDGVGAAAAALGCSVDEARALLTRMGEHDLVRVETSRVCLLVGSRRGRRGGMSPAERKRKERAGTPPEAVGVGSGRGNVTAGHGQVTSEPTGINGDSQERHGDEVLNVTPKKELNAPPPSPPPSPPSHTLPSLSPTPSSPGPAGGLGAGAPTTPEAPGRAGKQLDLLPDDRKADAKAPSKPARARKESDPAPMPFLVGEALAALAGAAAGRFTAGEGRDLTSAYAVQITAHIRKYPTLAEWETVGAWLADGAEAHRGTLGVAWVASASFRDAMSRARDWHARGRPPADARAASPRRPPVGPLPPAPREAWKGATGKASNPLNDPAIRALVNHGR